MSTARRTHRCATFTVDVMRTPAEASDETEVKSMPGTNHKLWRSALVGGLALVTLTAGADQANALSSPPEPPPMLAPTLAIGGGSISEGDAGRRVARIPITLSAPLDGDAWFTVETVEGPETATAGVDYKAMSKRKRIKAGVTETAVTLTIYGDTVLEPNESVELDISQLDGPRVAIVKSPARVGIRNDDDDPYQDDGSAVSVSGTSTLEGSNGRRKVRVVFSFGEVQSTDVFVTWATAAGTASADSDFKHVTSKTTRIKAGRTQRTALVTIDGDTEAESNEQLRVVVLAVSGGDGLVVPEESTGLIRILDDDLDKDGDGLFRNAEDWMGSDDNISDYDHDGLSDGEEVRLYFTRPDLFDTDGDGFDDGREIKVGSDPNDPSSTPPVV